MTQKELLYVEDAICHENEVMMVLQETMNMLDDEQLVDYLDNQIEIHEGIYNSFISLLKENANE